MKRLRAEYLEMPGLRLTSNQVERLCGVEPTMSKVVLDVLVNEKFLCATRGHYSRLTEGADVQASAIHEAELRAVHALKAS